MPKFYPSITDDLKDWLLSQPLFFVASAPLTGAHINVSPKGLPSQSLAVLEPNQVAYLDATGSGCETISHIYENGRVTLMACSFGTVPRIMRLFCKGRVIERGGASADDFEAWLTRTGIKHGVDACRAVIVLDVFKVQTSCGYGVPVVNNNSSSSSNNTNSPPRPSSPETTSRTTAAAAAAAAAGAAADPEAQSLQPPHQRAFTDRPTMNNFARKLAAKQPNAILDYQVQNNVRSLDGIPGLRTARAAKGEWVGLVESRARARRVISAQWEGVLVGLVVAVAAAALLIWLGWLRVEVVG
ncbi:pyridoxamine phosphate oxidase family protein [Phyllosticta citrichinensis]|uniref:Pyridoxamine phosphate oxidase family protein n=1 Tax=Phyllosticta citrichinensis TaxID=1130410 RepID=A0ABR1XUC8_9PEZI